VFYAVRTGKEKLQAIVKPMRNGLNKRIAKQEQLRDIVTLMHSK
jgi:hypothetical protein